MSEFFEVVDCGFDCFVLLYCVDFVWFVYDFKFCFVVEFGFL